MGRNAPLFIQVFELGLLEIKAHVVDSLPVVGGQCVELYPDKPIYDIPAVPVCTGQQLADQRFFVRTSKGTEFITTTIFIAAGVGSFQPRTLKVSGIDKHHGRQLFYCMRDPEPFRDKDIVICGGGDSALDWALQLGPLANWGLEVERRQIKVNTATFETSIPGIFAVGDINTYPGKKKLILSGFHEAALAAFGAAPYVFPGKKIHMQYTTTSTRLHHVLGVESPVFD
ncbi:NAD(P)/FAD-dependent oxidoreductase [Trinickia terrae]|uniref:NAD(P)/FAD-dependent oxidoreductase n=1 Tax=Trinickia terrae TaxID=2571161 RepID=A0A4U1IAG3_9BURK|nr:NAD(P)/FAD-dependent oxidoreductase [Trinickia terrae]TKC90335.1 NAD(P)/FAD-dependent oxidoreductase [Trinickia terrae]